MKDYEQMYYDLLYEYKKSQEKIENLEQKIQLLMNSKDMNLKMIIIDSLIEYKKNSTQTNYKYN